MTAMISDGALRAMRKKAGEGRPPPEFGIMNPVRGWRLSVPKAADDALALVATALSVTEMRMPSNELIEEMAEGSLITLLEGPGGQYGLAVLDPVMLSGIIEAATTGRVGSRAPAPRRATRTDAVICADFLDRLLELYEEAVAELEEAEALSGYRYATALLDPRLVQMTLPEAPYRQFTLTLDLESGAKQGELRIAFPAVVRQAGKTKSGDDGFQTALRSNVLGVRADLEAVLHKVSLPLRQVMSMQVGDVVPVPVEALGAVSVVAGGVRRVSAGRLGQLGGFRAVRLRDEVAADADGAADRHDDAFEAAAPAPAPARLPDLDFAAAPSFRDDDGDEAMLAGRLDGDASGAGGLPPLGELHGLHGDDEGGEESLDLPPLKMASLEDLPD